MIKKHKWQVIISNLVILLPVLTGLLLWNYLPEHIITHWGISGEPDRWSGRTFSIFGMPLIFLATHWLCIFITVRDSKNKNQSSKVFQMVLWILPIISLIICSSVYAIALGNDVNISMIVRVLLGLMFVILGNYMPKCRQNRTIGIKVRWTLKNEENWNKTHRFAGRLWVFGGLLLLATIFVPMENFVLIFLPLILIMAISPMIYSYVYYRKQLKSGTATSEDAVLTPEEEKTGKISMVVGIFIIVLAMLFLFTGKFEVSFGEDSFTIDAAYWDDIAVPYEEIDDIEYREQDDPNASSGRNFGYGSFTVLMGEFENGEFGKYTRYSYTSCDSCVVLTVDGNILVINGKDEEETKAIYDELCEKIIK